MKVQGEKIKDMNELTKALDTEKSLFVADFRKAMPTGFLRSFQFGYLLGRFRRGGIYYSKENHETKKTFFQKKKEGINGTGQGDGSGR
jgi:hypothetical protein